MERVSDFLNADIVCKGKTIGEIINFTISGKKIYGIVGIANTGIIRNRFFVPTAGITDINKYRAEVEKSAIVYSRPFTEEFASLFNAKNDNGTRIGDIFFRPDDWAVAAVSVRHGLFDDMIFGSEIVDINDIYITDTGFVVRK